MDIWEVVLLGIGLAMDATTVAMTDGMCECRMPLKKASFIALVFGGLQGLMPILGFYSGRLFRDFIPGIDQYIAFGILVILGIKMLYEGFKNPECTGRISYSKILLQGVATSIDALMVGLTLALLEMKIYYPALIIALITAVLSFSGVYLGRKFGQLIKNKALFLGGLILIAIGIKMLF
ncbi:MAG: manganese efflux pump [Acholeplasmataceae bacterium]|jgi:putative Mn2+ efflux pump MntP|nr:manganese efflux pump [Acholeplasmataceae bacterium]